MTFGEFKTLLQYRLGSRTALDTRIILETNHIQKQVLEGTGAFLPWFLFTGPVNLTLLSGENTVNLPADFLQERENYTPWYYRTSDSTWQKIYKHNFNYGEQLQDVANYPKSYSLAGEQFYFHPKADQDYTIRIFYYKRESVLTNDGDTNNWLNHASDLLLAEVGYKMAVLHIRDKEMANIFAEEITRARQRLFVLSESKEHVNKIMQMGPD